MTQNISILLGIYIKQQIQTRKYSSASEVVRAVLRLFECPETKETELIKELKR